MNKITLSNSFHGTEATVRPVPVNGRPGLGYVSRRTALRLKRTLCGISGCVCSDDFGQRGGDGLDVINQTSDRGYLVCV